MTDRLSLNLSVERNKLLREAMEELWDKIADMQAVTRLSAAEWIAVLRILEGKMQNRADQRRKPPSSVEER